MSFPAYEAYKDSGVEWLGEVPSHWAAPPCRAIATERTERNDDGECKDYLSLMANVGVIPYAEKGDIGNKKPEDLTKCKIVNEGDFVINSMNYYIGSYGESPYHGVCSPVYIVLTPKQETVVSRFAFRIFEIGGFQEYAQSYGNGILEHRRSINWDILKAIPVPVPPPEEQRTIASFLDTETSKIDGLVSEQRRLIELLKEKRQAVISHAVTKGLNPDVKMNDSGIQWLGDVPEHWTLHQLRRLVTKFVDYRGRTPTKTDSGVPLITAGAIRNGMIDHTRCPEYIAESDYDELMSRGLPELGDVVITTEAPLGEVAQVADSSVAFAQRVILFKGNRKRMLPDFMRYWYLSINGRDELFSRASGSTASGIRADRLKRSLVPTPPIKEQQEILDYLEPLLERLVAPVADAERAIELLQERRTALISAAVTGKIDVRGYAQTKQEAVA